MVFEAFGPVQTVAQQTNVTTGVTLNAVRGQITTQAASTAAGAEDEFVLTNSYIRPTSVVAVSFATASAGTPVVTAGKCAGGSCTITITNLSGATALNNTLVINYVVIN